MAANTRDVLSAVQQLAGVLLRDAERIAELSQARVQQLLPPYADVPRESLVPVTLTNVRNLLEAVRYPEADRRAAADHFRVSGETRARQGITADEMLQAWRIVLEVVREEAHQAANRLEISDEVLLEFVEATLEWGDIGMRASAAAHREAEIRELERLAADQAALRRVATLVARASPPDQVFASVAEEVALLLGLEAAAVLRFDADDKATMVGNWGGEIREVAPVGSRLPLDGEGLIPVISRTRRPGRFSLYNRRAGELPVLARKAGLRASVGSPIVVGGRVWGAIVAATTREGPLPEAAESRIAEFTELVATAISNAEGQSEIQRLAKEQAALRGVATHVARGVGAEVVFRAVAEEVHALFGADLSAVLRYEADGTVTLMGSRGGPNAIGARVEPNPGYVVASVRETGRAARFDTDDPTADGMPAIVRTEGIRSAVASPIVVDGRLWGAVTAASAQGQSLSADAESRVADFTELLATAIANLQAREDVERLAEEQAALRRVATLVAREASEAEIFAAIAMEIGHLLGTDEMRMMRYESNAEAVVVAAAGPRDDVFRVGSRWPLGGENVASRVFRTGQPARVDDYRTASGRIAEAVRSMSLRAVVGTPIVVHGQLWGTMVTGTFSDEPLPPDTEFRLGQFTELMATGITSAEDRAELAASEARAHDLAREQAALRRVATLVAEGASADELFCAVTREVAGVIAVPVVGVHRYETDATFTTMGVAGETSFTVGSRWPIEKEGLADVILSTRRPARKDDYSRMPGRLGAAVRHDKMLSTVGVPIVVDGSVWGFMVAAATPGKPLPDQTEERFARFIELIATAIANSQARASLEQLADEQAALRRVATLVAEGAPAGAVFEAVAAEMERVLGADGVTLNRYASDEEAVVLAHSASDPLARRLPAGTRVNHRGENVTSLVRSSRSSARLEHNAGTPGAIAKLLGNLHVRASVGAPIVVDGRLWGVAVAHWSGAESPPADTEQRMAKFVELLDTAVANADSRDQLTASRTRLVTEADEARRRVVRDLHDGAQQRLVHTIVTLKLAQRALQEDDQKARSLIAESLEQAEQGNRELRELAHGILPAVLAQGGLRAGVDTIVARLELPVDVNVPAERFPAEVEASAYFIVSEALTNVVKHAGAERAEVRAFVQDGVLKVVVRDDGTGGADATGHGLVGLGDRVTALGGRFKVESPEGVGTLVAAELPLAAN